jgi:putative ABC transport system ATP-binding protein
MAKQSLIELQEIRLSLPGPSGRVDILNGINVDITAGAKVSLVGPSGSGKTSLLMVMAGLERATSGRIVIDGHDITNLDEDELARFRRERIGIVFQDFHLIPTMTAEENVALPLELAANKMAQRRSVEALDAVGLAHRRNHFPSQLSGGEQQRVALARAFVASPRILLADEPTGNLDQETGGQVMALLLDLHRQNNTTLVLITHDPSLAATCDQRLVMRDGRLQ